jgi:hypothetical protein
LARILSFPKSDDSAVLRIGLAWSIVSSSGEGEGAHGGRPPARKCAG